MSELSTTDKSHQDQQPPGFVVRNLVGDMQRRLDPLIGEWTIARTLYIAAGSPEHPLTVNGMKSRCEWISETGNRFIRHVISGMLDGQPYFRLGLLGYSNVDARYEYVTVDSINTNMMTYRGNAGDEPLGTSVLSMEGEFTDPGVLRDDYAGKTIRQRTTIDIDSSDQHTFRMFFTPPGEDERLVDQMICTRAVG